MALRVKAENVPVKKVVLSADQGQGSMVVKQAYGNESSLMVATRPPGYHTKPHMHVSEQINHVMALEITDNRPQASPSPPCPCIESNQRRRVVRMLPELDMHDALDRTMCPQVKAGEVRQKSLERQHITPRSFQLVTRTSFPSLPLS